MEIFLSYGLRRSEQRLEEHSLKQQVEPAKSLGCSFSRTSRSRKSSAMRNNSTANHHRIPTKPTLGASLYCYRFFHPPLCPGAPPLERGAGPNSGPDWRESVGWKILLPVLGPASSR